MNINRSIKIIITVLLIGTVSTLGYLLHNHQISSDKQSKSYSSAAAYLLSLPDDEQQKMFDEDIDSRWSFSNAEEASQELPFKFKMPDEKLTGKPSYVFIPKNQITKDRKFYVHYENGVNGLKFEAHQRASQPDYAANIEQIEIDIKNGVHRGADKMPTIIDRKGCQYYAIEPGYNIIGGDKIPRPGYLLWWQDGISYELYGTKGPDGTSIDGLIAIAESVNNSNVSYCSGKSLIDNNASSESNANPITKPTNIDDNN
ncbi:MAG: hypothetical protein ACM3MK_08885 [Chitinophagales bacterium]